MARITREIAILNQTHVFYSRRKVTKSELLHLSLGPLMSGKGRQSIVQSFYDAQLASVGPCLAHVRQAPLRNCLKQKFLEEAAAWSVNKTFSPFTRRVTALEWHPVYHNVVAFASHGGDIQLWNFDDSSRNVFVRGLGYGYGCITSMKFNPENPRYVYTTSVDGRFLQQDLEGRQSSVFLDTQNISHWWCSLDISRQHNVMVVGGNTGQAVLLDSRGEVVRKYKKLHRGKVKYAEFCPSGRWLLATASVDHTVALWDIRMLRSGSGGSADTDRPAPLHTLRHSAPVNSATFDPHTGTRLLTTAQNSVLQVHDAGCNWEQPTTVFPHPHRHFQHMTDIVATWHPLHQDLCVVGRYPEKDDRDKTRTVDLIELEGGSARLAAQLSCPTLKGIVVLNKFSRCGGWLASGMGYHCILWKLEQRQWESLKEHRNHRKTVDPAKRGIVKRRRPGGHKDDDRVAKKLKKMAVAQGRKKVA